MVQTVTLQGAADIIERCRIVAQQDYPGATVHLTLDDPQAGRVEMIQAGGTVFVVGGVASATSLAG